LGEASGAIGVTLVTGSSRGVDGIVTAGFVIAGSPAIGRGTTCFCRVASVEIVHGAGVIAVSGSSFEVADSIGALVEAARGEGNTTAAGNGSTLGDRVTIKAGVRSGTATTGLGTGSGDGAVAIKDSKLSMGCAAWARIGRDISTLVTPAERTALIRTVEVQVLL